MGTAAILAVAVVSTYFLANLIRVPSGRKGQSSKKEKRKPETLRGLEHERK